MAYTNAATIAGLMNDLCGQLMAVSLADLPGVKIVGPEFVDLLPLRMTCVYFLHSQSHGLLYIGPAIDLRD